MCVGCSFTAGFRQHVCQCEFKMIALFIFLSFPSVLVINIVIITQVVLFSVAAHSFSVGEDCFAQ